MHGPSGARSQYDVEEIGILEASIVNLDDELSDWNRLFENIDI